MVNKSNINSIIEKKTTVIFSSLEELNREEPLRTPKPKYGRRGNTTVFDLENEISRLEKGKHTVLCPSGHNALIVSILSFLNPNDCIGIYNGVYPSTKNTILYLGGKYNFNVVFFKDEEELAKITQINKIKTILFEFPGSYTYSILDIDKCINIIKNKNIISIVDNTWSAGVLFNPLLHGFDITIQSISKYISGTSDILMGSITCNDDLLFKTIKSTYNILGLSVNSNDCYDVLKSIKTLDIRLEKHYNSALIIANLLNTHGLKTYFPALNNFEYNSLWKKYFIGGNGLITFVPKQKVEYNLLTYFSLGYGWGGSRSLILPITNIKSIRLNIGLEKVEDLVEDLLKVIK